MPQLHCVANQPSPPKSSLSLDPLPPHIPGNAPDPPQDGQPTTTTSRFTLRLSASNKRTPDQRGSSQSPDSVAAPSGNGACMTRAHQQEKSYKHKEGNSLVYEPESVFQAVPAVDRAGSQTQQDRRFRQLQLPSSIRWHRLQTIVARDAPLAADKREAGVRVFQSSDTAGDARAVRLGLRGLRIGELARILDESAAGAATANQRPFARERSFDGGVAVYCF